MKSRKINVLILVLTASLMVLNSPSQAAEITVPEDIINLSEDIGTEYGICPELLQAIAFKESSFNPKARNGLCIGLMQINRPMHFDRMDKLGVTDLYDLEQNMRVAADLLVELRDRYEDIGVVLMAYNGFKGAEEYVVRTGELSDYAQGVLELSAQLEEMHGK